MAGNKGQFETKIKISGEVLPSFDHAMKRAYGEMEGLYYKARRENAGFMSGVDNLDKMADKTFSLVGKAVKATAAGAAGILAASTMAGAGYEEQMSTVAAISGASAADMLRLDKLAQEMGRNTKFSAKEAGEGLEYMAMAGWKTDQMISGLPGILNLAAASGEDLGQVSDIVTDDLTAFGLAAEEAGRFSDVLAAASSNSNTNVAMMGETFKYAAPVAGALGYTIEDVALATGLMANAGIKAENAGTAMRSLFTNMAKPTEDMQSYMDRLGISLTDSSGNMKTFRQQLESIRKGFSSLTEAQRAEYAAGIAGKYGMSGLLAIVNANEADFQKLADSIDNSAGAAERMAEVRIDNLTGDFTLLKSAAEGAGIGIYGAFSSVMREAVQGASDAVNDFTESGFLEKLSEDMPSVRREMKAFGKAAGDFAEPLLSAGKWFLKHPDVIAGTITGIGSAMLTFKAVKGVSNLVSAFGALAGMTSAWPVAAAGLAIGGIVGIGTAIQTAERNAARANLEEHFGRITLSVEELGEAARHVIGDGLFDSLDSFHSASEASEELRLSLESGLKEISKADWKLHMGIAFDESDTDSYVDTVDSYVKNAQEYITASGYEVKLAVGVVFGEEGQDFSDESDAFYQSLYQKLQPLKEGLQETMADITENGLSLPKQQIVDGYLNDISDITSMITEAENAAKMQMIESQYAGASLSSESFQNLQQSIQEYTDEASSGIDESFQTILTSLNARKIAGQKGMEGGISEEEFQDSYNKALNTYYGQKAQVIQNGYQIMEDTIMATYGDEIKPAMEAVNKQIGEDLPQLMESNTTPEQFQAAFEKLIMDSVNAAGMSPDAKNAISMLFKNMAPTQEDMEQLKQQIEAVPGAAIPEAINETLGKMSSIGAVTGDTDSIWKIVGDKIADNEDYAVLISAVNQQTGQIPETVIKAIGEKNGEIQSEAEKMLLTLKSTLESGVYAEIPITLNTVASYREGTLPGMEKKAEHHASGGLMNYPTLSYFAEESPEMAIPIDGSRRAVSLWEETGRLLGVYSQNNYRKTYERLSQSSAVVSGTSGSAAPVAPVYAPVMNFYGNTTKEEVEAAGMTKYEEFCQWIERYNYEKSREAFA